MAVLKLLPLPHGLILLTQRWQPRILDDQTYGKVDTQAGWRRFPLWTLSNSCGILKHALAPTKYY